MRNSYLFQKPPLCKYLIDLYKHLVWFLLVYDVCIDLKDFFIIKFIKLKYRN